MEEVINRGTLEQSVAVDSSAPLHLAEGLQLAISAGKETSVKKATATTRAINEGVAGPPSGPRQPPNATKNSHVHTTSETLSSMPTLAHAAVRGGMKFTG